jgi:hypothetical protein
VAGGALVWLLIVRNFQEGSRNGITAKFAMISDLLIWQI